MAIKRSTLVLCLKIRQNYSAAQNIGDKLSLPRKKELPLIKAPPLAADVLAALPEAVLTADGAGNIVYANFAAQHIFGLGEKALCQSDISRLFGAAHPVCEAFASGKSVIITDVSLPSGQKISRLSVTPLGTGAVLLLAPELLLMKKDWTRKMRENIKPAQHMARALAHEIKNPLAGIHGAAQLLQTSELSDDDRQLAQLIVEEAARILRLMGKVNIFDTGDFQSGAPVNIHEVLDHVIAAAKSGFGREAGFSAQFDPSLPEVAGAPDMLVQAFMNLVKNAVEAAGSAAAVTLRTRFNTAPPIHPESGCRLPICIEVEDNGPGIDPAIMDRLFEPYFTTRPAGEGLGLSIVYQIIDAHGGVVEIDSRPGRTVFSVSLPRSDRA